MSHYSLGDRVRYYMKKPGKGRASFSILKDVVRRDGERLQEKVEDPRLLSINQALKDGVATLNDSEAQVKEIIRGLYDEVKRVQGAGRQGWHEENQKIFDAYWARNYETKKIRNKPAARDRLIRALNAAGALSITSASREELEDAINRRAHGRNNKQRALASALNQLLRFVRRSDTLRLAEEEHPEVRYLTPKEFERVLKHVEDEKLRLLYKVCFGTGARLGEAFALAPSSIAPHKKSANIREQILRTGLTGKLKNNRPHHAYILPEYRPAVIQWAKLPKEERLEFRRTKLAEILKLACVLEFPEDTVKHCTAHDLRHCYAVFLVQKGVSLAHVAQSLGDSIVTAERYYSGFSLKPEGIDVMDAVVTD